MLFLSILFLERSAMADKKSVKELKSYEFKKEYIAQIREAIRDKTLQLANLTQAAKSKTFTAFNKNLLRGYQKNPKANEQSLRELSQFLYRMSHQYRRLINYYAEMIDLTAYSVVPLIDIEKEDRQDKKKLLKRYGKTLKQIRKMSLQSEIMKALIIAWREDVFYGYTYEDSEGFFILPLLGQYCRISSINMDGTLNFAFDFSYFRNNADDLEYWDTEFEEKYNLYLKDVKNFRWQELDRNRTICLKVNVDTLDLITPPFMQLFPQIIDLIDLQDIQAVKDELSAYKLLVARLETLNGTDEPDDFSVDVDTAIEYFNRLQEELPETVGSCISPLKIDAIEFKGTTTEDVDMISNSMSNLFKAAGVSQILDSDNISGDEAFKAAIMCDSLMAIRILLPQIEKWHNRYLKHVMSNPYPVKYIEVTPYIKDELIEKYKTAAQYGVPVKIAYTTLLGFDPLETLSLAFLENDCMKLTDKWKPLQSSHTQSGKAVEQPGTSEVAITDTVKTINTRNEE